MTYHKLLPTGLYFFLLFFCPCPSLAFAAQTRQIQGHYEGTYTEGPWFWQRQHNFHFFLHKVASERHGKITFYHHKFGKCEGNYFVNKDQEDRHERLVIYSSNLTCQKQSQDYFVLQMILPGQIAPVQSRPFSSKFYLRSTTNNHLRIQEKIALKYLLSDVAPSPLSS